jgi:hypothetical protein
MLHAAFVAAKWKGNSRILIDKTYFLVTTVSQINERNTTLTFRPRRLAFPFSYRA